MSDDTKPNLTDLARERERLLTSIRTGEIPSPLHSLSAAVRQAEAIEDEVFRIILAGTPSPSDQTLERAREEATPILGEWYWKCGPQSSPEICRVISIEGDIITWRNLIFEGSVNKNNPEVRWFHISPPPSTATRQAPASSPATGDDGFEKWASVPENCVTDKRGNTVDKDTAKWLWCQAWSAARADADARIAAHQRFKDYVHKRLDEAGIPTHPEGSHSKEGCRVGDRLDILIGQRDAYRQGAVVLGAMLRHEERQRQAGWGSERALGNLITEFNRNFPALAKEVCTHERLNEDGVCRACGADRRGI